MHLVGKASGVSLFASDDSYLSFFNSPYVGHRRCSAIDIYPSHEQWNGPALSPCEGVIKRIRRFKMGGKKSFPTEDYDYAIGIAPEDCEDVLVRVLHCAPDIEEGAFVKTGDNLGKVIRSRYFNFWTGPHYHVEVLHPKNFTRPSQSYPISLKTKTIRASCRNASNEIECVISRCTRNIMICGSRDFSFASTGKHYGHLALIGELLGIIDAGIPHYKQGGLLVERISETDSQIEGFGTSLGQVLSSKEQFAQFAVRDNLIVRLNGEEIKGISMHLYPKNKLIDSCPPIFLIPKGQEQFASRYSEGDCVILSLDVVYQS